MVSWQGLYEQFGLGFARQRDFRSAFRKVLDQVAAQYRAARLEADSAGVGCHHSPPPVASRLVAIPKRLG